jgi:hypothetical protein
MAALHGEVFHAYGTSDCLTRVFTPTRRSKGAWLISNLFATNASAMKT